MTENMNKSKIKSKVNTIKERERFESLCASFNYFIIGGCTRKMICIIIENEIGSLHIYHCKISWACKFIGSLLWIALPIKS